MRRRALISAALLLLLLSCLTIISCVTSSELGVRSSEQTPGQGVVTLPSSDYVIIQKKVLSDLMESAAQCASERNECLDKLRAK